jgi:hypothetical protein
VPISAALSPKRIRGVEAAGRQKEAHVLSECPALRELRVDGSGQLFVPTLYGEVSQMRDTAAFLLRALRE